MACKIKTGQYTGDGTTSQAITGVGFTPKYVIIFPRYETAQEVATTVHNMNQFYTGLSIKETAGAFHYDTDKIISLDSDGFTVDDAGIDDHPNKDAQAYAYIAWG